VQINDFTNADPARSLRQGHVGIQNHGASDQVAFRNIRVKELSVTVEAESCTSSRGVRAVRHSPAGGGKTLGHINDGDWAGYAHVTTEGATAFSARVSSAGSGGTIQVRSGSPRGPLLGSVTVPVTGGWESFRDVATTLTASATGPLHLVFKGGRGFLFDVDSFTLGRYGP
ncbi:carbohydrate-binding protein, partial [Nonomuraea sp. MTCD27]|uniref:carbohydrate-binding protein n=1 Tax=Nonomuraea sp. MTCD27 TaxID=1676747 RepID=UPI0035BF4BB5